MSTKNKQRAKLALAELEKEMEILTKEEMNAYKGGESYIRRDASGNIIFSPIYSAELEHPSGITSMMQMGYIYADDGTPIEAYNNYPYEYGGKREMDTDCHGVTFGDGKFWINNDQVPSILKGDAYKEVSEGNYQTGDVVVHSVTISSSSGYIEGSTGSGLGGVQTDISTTSLKSGFHRYDKIKVFRK